MCLDFSCRLVNAKDENQVVATSDFNIVVMTYIISL